MQLKNAGCADTISPDILYALGFDNGGQILLKETGLGARAEGSWWTRTHQPNQNEEARVIFLRVNKADQKSSLGFGVYPLYTGFPVRCLRKPEPVKPGIKLPALSKLNCDSLLVITKARVKLVKPVEKKTEPVITDYVLHMAGTYKDFTCVLSAGKEVTFTPATVYSSHFTVEKALPGYASIDFEIRLNQSTDSRFFLQFLMQAGEAIKTGTGTATGLLYPCTGWKAKQIPISRAYLISGERMYGGLLSRDPYHYHLWRYGQIFQQQRSKQDEVQDNGNEISTKYEVRSTKYVPLKICFQPGRIIFCWTTQGDKLITYYNEMFVE